MKGLLVLLFLLQTGFLINVFKALSHRPAELRAFLNYHEVVMARRGKIPVVSLFKFLETMCVPKIAEKGTYSF